MNNKELLKDCLAHWNRMLDLTVDEIKEGREAPYAYNCAFCGEYNRMTEDGIDCSGCPVREKSGVPGCLGTPWEDVEVLYEEIENGEHRRLSEFRHAVKREIKFLESLEVE